MTAAFKKWRQYAMWFVKTALVACFVVGSPPLARADVDSLAGKPVIGKNADGLLEVFKVDANGLVRHRWQKPANGDWSAWSSLAGSFLPGMVVVTNENGELEVFAVSRTNHALMNTHQKSPNGHDWLEWSSLGGAIQPELSVGRNADGRLEIFALALDGSYAMHLWQTNAHRGWSAWSNLGGNIEGRPVVVADGLGCLQVFGVDAHTKNLVHCRELHPNASGEWSDWEDLGGPVQPGFVPMLNAHSVLQVFAVSVTNAAVMRIYQTSTNINDAWSPWMDFGATVGADPNLASARSADGRLEIFAVRASNGAILHRWETMHGGSDLWSPWSDLGNFAQPHLAAEANEDGNLEVFAVDRNNPDNIIHRRQISSASDWLDWSSLDHHTFEYSSRNWQVDDGLPNNLVQTITQTHDGYLWVGTAGGLARFDGVYFSSFDTRNVPELKNSSITALCADTDGALWIGTDGGGLSRLKNGIWSHYGKTDGLAGDNLRVIYKTTDGALWIGTTTGMSQFKNGKFINYTTREGLFSDTVSYIYEDRDATLWVATGKGLNRLRAGKIMDSFAMPRGLPNDAVRGICQDKGGRIWIGSNNGMLWYNWYWTGSFYAYNTRYGLSDSFVSTICEDSLGNLWVGTYSGLNRFHEGRFYSELNDEGVPYDKVNALFEDREGNLWVGSNEGLIRLTPRRFTTYAKQQGLSHNHVMSVLEDRSGGIWLGTWGGGVDKLKNERVMVYPRTNAPVSDLVLSLCESRDGSIWSGLDYDGGLARFKEGKYTRYVGKKGLPSAPIQVIHEDRRGKIWIGTAKGLSCLKNDEFTNYPGPLAGEDIREIFEDHEGVLWFGTASGLSRLKDGALLTYSWREGLSDNVVTAICEDNAQNLWIGTANGGLNRFNKGKFTTYRTQQGLFSDEIFSIIDDQQGWLWMSCSRGIFRVLKRDLDLFDQEKIKTIPCNVFGRSDGMESTQCTGAGKPSAWRAHDGRLWFPTSKGAVVVNPYAIKDAGALAPVYIEKLIADKRSWLRVTPTRFISTEGNKTESMYSSSIEIPPGRGELEFQYTMLSFQAPEKCRFSYMLEGIDSDWVDAGPRRTAHYNNVPPGSYRFRVVACGSDGIWNEMGATLAIIIRPHLWQRWWVQAGASLMLIFAATGMAVHLGKRNMLRKLAVLEQENAIERERARIAKDMHDQLGAGLTQVGLLGELSKRDSVPPDQRKSLAGKICDIAREQAQILDEIVWTVDPKNDTLTKLADYMAVFVEEFFKPADIRVRLDIPPGLPPLPVPSDFRHNLFLVVKEAMNNIVKHSGATAVLIRFVLNGEVLDVTIQDNGKGFDVKNTDQFGNGLSNMEQRVRDMGGNFELESAAEKGTRIHFQVALKKSAHRNEP